MPCGAALVLIMSCSLPSRAAAAQQRRRGQFDTVGLSQIGVDYIFSSSVLPPFNVRRRRHRQRLSEWEEEEEIAEWKREKVVLK